MRKTAPHDAGVWRLPGGDAFYADALKSATTTNLTPDEVHKIGLDEVARLEGEMTVLLDKTKQPPGPLGERMERLMKIPAELYPDTDAGRAQILDYLHGLEDFVEKKGPEVFSSLP